MGNNDVVRSKTNAPYGLAGYVGGTPGKLLFVASEAAEAGGTIKAGYDAIQGNPQNLSLLTIEKVIPIAIDANRLNPDVGLVFNLISLGMNLIPAINLKAIKYQ